MTGTFRRDRRLTALFVKVGKQAVPLTAIARVDGERLERLEVDLHLVNGEVITAHGIDAVELMMQVKPVMVEGHRLRYGRWDWLVHNLVGHPLMQLLAVFRLYRWAFWVHDATVPRPRGRHPRTEAAMAARVVPAVPVDPDAPAVPVDPSRTDSGRTVSEPATGGRVHG